MEAYQSIGKRIAALRKARGMTQDQLAERVGVTPQAVSKWENDNSCPDISIVPQVAEALGVTTDELLGVKPIEPRVVVVDGKRDGGPANTASPFHWAGEKGGGILFAVLVILLGVAFLLSRTSVWPFGELNFWNVVWPAVLLGVGISWLIREASPFALGVALLGLYYLLFNLGAITYVLTWGVIWPVLLILGGISLLLDRLVPNRKARFHGHGGHEAAREYSDEGGFVRLDAAFAEFTQVVDVPLFTGGDIDTSFGKTVIDLSRCGGFVPNAQLKVDVSFGACEICLPRTVRLTQNVDRAFGNVEVRGDADADAPYTLSLCGDTSFGSLLIRYY